MGSENGVVNVLGLINGDNEFREFLSLIDRASESLKSSSIGINFLLDLLLLRDITQYTITKVKRGKPYRCYMSSILNRKSYAFKNTPSTNTPIIYVKKSGIICKIGLPEFRNSIFECCKESAKHFNLVEGR